MPDPVVGDYGAAPIAGVVGPADDCYKRSLGAVIAG